MFTLLDLDPNIVKPGWTPLLITIALAAVMVLLFIAFIAVTSTVLFL